MIKSRNTIQKRPVACKGEIRYMHKTVVVKVEGK
jgi:hypothetical protein